MRDVWPIRPWTQSRFGKGSRARGEEFSELYGIMPLIGPAGPLGSPELVLVNGNGL